MLYALRNIGRLKGKSALTFLLAFVIIFLSMFGIMTNSLCNDSKERFYGPLDGTYAVTDTDGNPYLSYKAASYIKKTFRCYFVHIRVKRICYIFKYCGICRQR